MSGHARTDAPWCGTCGKVVTEVTCQQCSKWWADHDLEKRDMQATIDAQAAQLAALTPNEAINQKDTIKMTAPEITDADRAIADKVLSMPGANDQLHDLTVAAALARTGWKPEPEIDPDLIEVREIVAKRHKNKGRTRFAEATRRGAWDNEAPVQLCLKAIKRGRELAAPQEWRKHNGSSKCPVDGDSWVLVSYKDGGGQRGYRAGCRDWKGVTYYLPIPKPEDAA